MKVILFPSSSGVSGNKKMDIDLTGNITVSELLEMLEQKADFLRPYIHKKGGKIVGLRFVLVRGEEILKLDDLVHAEDTIEVLPPIAGG